MFQSTHKLEFLSGPWPLDPEWFIFHIGTCHGQWRSTPTAYEILSIVNYEPGNGHLGDVLEWFENSCKRDHRDLRVLHFENDFFRDHMIEKRGFRPMTFLEAGGDPYWKDHLIKKYT